MKNLKRALRTPIVWILLGIALVLGYFAMQGAGGFQQIDTSSAEQLIREEKVKSAKVTPERVDLTLKDGEKYSKGEVKDADKVQAYVVPGRAETVVKQLQEHVPPEGYDDDPEKQGFLTSMLLSLVPFILIVAVFWFFLSQMQGGGSKVMQFGKSKAKMASKDTPKVTFTDVAGADEAVEELHEIKDFLTDPRRFLEVGAKIPKGVLLYGPPGTGKTLLARAVAGEANVPFFSISGSDFVEMFVGVGASRVRDLFDQAKQNAPAIIFVDEIDAVGRHRGAGLGGGHDEREQTLNQLLVEMDGFDPKTNVILIAATNRPDILDPALLRPGRFDRQIAVEAPDMKGRHAILKVHAKGKPMTNDVDLLAVAKRTPGFTGADLANVLNEAALLTARSNARLVDNRALDEAIDRVVAGPQKRTRIMSAREKKMTAYHEGGHALVAAGLNHTEPVTKITILPRGRALGYTMVVPADDKYSASRNELLDQLAYALGGRVAEEVVFHDPGTGASNDIDKATQTARAMVMHYGMSEKVGAVRLGQGDGEVFLGRDMGHQRDYSEQLAGLVDQEVRRFLDQAHDEAWEIITTNRHVLDRLVLELLERETLNTTEIAEIFRDVQKAPERPIWLSSQARPVSDRPAVLTAAEEKALAEGKDLGRIDSQGNVIDEEDRGGGSDGGAGNPPAPGGPVVDPLPPSSPMPPTTVPDPGAGGPQPGTEPPVTGPGRDSQPPLGPVDPSQFD